MLPTPTPAPTATGVLGLAGRALFGTATTPTPPPPHCTAFDLPAGGVLVLNGTATTTLQNSAVYQPFCSDLAVYYNNGTLPITDYQDPFVASTIPQVFVIGAVLVFAWTLVVILFITPRTSLIGGAFIGRARGSTSVISSGRPWLQKVAALTVFVSFLIAAVNSLRVAYFQYTQGYEDAGTLTQEVVGSMEIRVMRVLSDTFIWLAQVQTLIRLFPRHKEKVIIKWIGFALITLDTIFSILDNFKVESNDEFSRPRPHEFSSPISALWYLFQLSLSIVYMASVLYYSFVKRRFAYYHYRMRSISFVALLAIVSVSIPVVFFIVDISNGSIIAWGDYVRWVGAAAASVVVWEWVERIEALERQERKDGILGREIFEGDEAPQFRRWKPPSWPPRRRKKSHLDSDSDDSPNSSRGDASGFSSGDSTAVSHGKSRVAFWNRIATIKLPLRGTKANSTAAAPVEVELRPPAETQTRHPVLGRSEPATDSIPPMIASPVSRSDTTSAASTVYAVIHHPVAETPPAIPVASDSPHRSGATPGIASADVRQPQPSTESSTSGPSAESPAPPVLQPLPPAARSRRSRLSRPFRRLDPTNIHIPTSPSLDSPTSPSSPNPDNHKNNSSGSFARGIFRLHRSPPEPQVDLPVYVLSGGSDGKQLLVEPRMDVSHATPSSMADTSSPPTPSHVHPARGESPDDNARGSALPSIDNAFSRQTPPNPSGSTVRGPASLGPSASGVTEAPPPFSVAPNALPAANGPLTASSSPPLASLSSSSPVNRTAGNGSRHSRRSPLSMPVLMERESDAGGGSEATSPAGDAGGAPSPGNDLAQANHRS